MAYFEDGDKYRKQWKEYIAAFRVEVYPIFEAEGIGFEAAFLIWKMNAQLNNIADDIRGRGDDGSDTEPWRS